MTTDIVIGDVHGRENKLKTLLMKLGLLDEEKIKHGIWARKNDEVNLIQLGDLVDLGTYAPGQEEFYLKAFPLFDEALIGNHELPAVHRKGISFEGFDPADPNVAHIRMSYRAGLYKVATSVGEYLITHAGLYPRFFSSLPGGPFKDAHWMAGDLNDHFHFTQEMFLDEPMFDNIDWERGGNESFGSIFWCDFKILERGYIKRSRDELVPQVVGHTGSHGSQSPYAMGLLWNIDTPKVNIEGEDPRELHGGVMALVFEDGIPVWTEYVA